MRHVLFFLTFAFANAAIAAGIPAMIVFWNTERFWEAIGFFFGCSGIAAVSMALLAYLEHRWVRRQISR